MSIIYFSNNADSGNGSLRTAIASAKSGDIIRPDESVFKRGSTIEIVLASPLRFTKVLTLDASPFRVRLDGGGSQRCVVCLENSTADSVVEFTAFDFVRGAYDASGGGIFSGGTLTLNRCGFYGCSGVYGGGVYCRYFLTLNDCVVTGCRAASVAGGILAERGMALNGVTSIGNVSPRGSDVCFGEGGINASNSIIGGVYSSNPGSVNYVGCVVNVPSSQIGFVASPPDDLTADNWDANAWQNWDLRLLDDASDTPSPYRDSGDVGAMSRYDLEGNFRGRKTNGVATCSPGAYETIQADLFWVGEPFPQEMVDAAPQNIRIANYRQTTGSTFFEADMTWEIPDGAVYSKIAVQYKSPSSDGFVAAQTIEGDATGRKSTQLREGSRYIVRIRGVFENGDYTAWVYVDFVASAALDDADGGGQTSGTMLPTELSVIPSFLTSDGWATSRFATAFDDVAPQAGQTVFVDGDVSFVEFLSKNTGLIVGGGAVFASSVYQTNFYASKLQVGLGATFKSKFTSAWPSRVGAWARLTMFGAASATVDFDVASQADYFRFAAGKLSTVPFYGRLELRPAFALSIEISGKYYCSSLTVIHHSGATDLRIKAESVTFRVKTAEFTGNSENQSDLFDAPVVVELRDAAKVTVPDGAPESWADAFEVDATDAASATLTLNGQTVYGDAPTCAVSLTGTARIDERGLTSQSLTLNADAALNVDGGRVDVELLTVADGANVAFANVNGDAIISVNDASIGTASFTGIGYLASSTEIDLTATAVDETVRVCDYGADVQSFSATSVGKTVTLRWSVNDYTRGILVEILDNNEWLGTSVFSTDGSLVFESDSAGDVTFRVFDGEKFLQTTVYVESFHAWLTYDNLFTSAIVVKSYTVVTEYILMSSYFNAGEAPVLLARIADSLTNVAVTPNDVESISLTVYKTQLYRGVKQRVVLEGWGDVDVPLTAVMESLIVDDPRWKKDSVGYNFRYEPDLREKPLFNESGEYVVVVTIKFKEGNPAPLVFNVSVK